MFAAVKDYFARLRNQRRMEQKGLVGSRKRRTDTPLRTAADQSKVLGALMLIALWGVCSLMLMLPSLQSGRLPLVLTQSAPKTIFSDFDFAYKNIEKTDKLKRDAVDQVPLYFKISDTETAKATQNLKSFFAAVAVRANSEKQSRKYIPDSDYFSNLVAGMDNGIIQSVYSLIQNDQQSSNFEKELDLVMGQGVFSQKEKNSYKVGQQIRIIDSRGRDRFPKMAVDVPTPEEAAEVIVDAVLKYYSPSGDRDILRKNLIQASVAVIGMHGNLTLDAQRTETKRKETAEAVKPVMVEVKKYQPVIAKGQIVNAEMLTRLETYEKICQERLQETDTGQKLFRNITWSLILMIFVGFYMYHIHPEVVRSNQKIGIAGAVIVISLMANYLFIELFNYFSANFSIPPELVNDAIPMALPAILLAVMIGFRVALYVGFFVAAITSMMLGNSFDVALEGLVVCCLSGIAVRSAINYRSFFLRSILIVFATFWLLDFNILYNISARTDIMLWTAGLSLINSFITATTALILIFVFELFFNVSTNMSLLMLCDYNHPLLKRLQLEAPGTFHHSLMAATLAEYAAKAINANPVKARVGAIFHDIGKLTKPEYFAENNVGAESKHDDLHPRMSSLIILNHVKEGVDLALKYKLRKIIRDTIQQHHGTDIVYYFYKRALDDNREKGLQVDEGEYRYPGPLPSEKEVVIVSLADACEAASRSLQKPTPNKVEAMVWEIFRKRIRDGQMDDAKLTIAELAKIRDSFVKTLTTMTHSRIAYPKDEEDEDDLFMEANKNVAPSEKTDNPAGEKSV
ncbi:MAG: HDIG domain-containing metalloprotein [Victivallaceae bacterium]